MFDPPKCANYCCGNNVPRERWLWETRGAMTCSKECAMVLTLEARIESIVNDNPRCARKGCLNKVTVKRSRFCSRRCANRVQFGEKLGHNLAIAEMPQKDEITMFGQCARPGCTNTIKQSRNRYCSHACAAVQTGGDRWEKVAPRMTYTDEVRNQMINQLYKEEVSRTNSIRRTSNSRINII
jgi:hypothetical protein